MLKFEYIHEDFVPDLPNDLFTAAREASTVIDGVRMFPTIILNGTRLLCVAPPQPRTFENYKCSDPMDV